MCPNRIIHLIAVYLLIATTLVNGRDTTEVSLVIEPFEYQHIDYLWNISSNLGYSYSPDALFGEYALQLTVDKGPQEAVFHGVLERGAHRCHNADFISVWYKTTGKFEGTTSVSLTLYSDIECSATASNTENSCIDPTNLVQYAIFDFNLSNTSASSWQELRMYDIQDFDLRRIKGYKVRLQSTSGVSLLVDQLACHGDGTMFDLFALDEGYDLESRLSDESVAVSFYQSEMSANETSIELDQDGSLYVDYLVQQSETWGGYLAIQTKTVASAYYNLSDGTALVLDYAVIEAASISSKITMRIVLLDGSDCAEICENELATVDTTERWYSFHPILDKEGQGQLVIPFEGDIEPGSSLWLTGWDGVVGNAQLDMDHVKGLVVELNVDSTLGFENTVTGALQLSNFHVIKANASDAGTTDRCVLDESLYIVEGFEVFTTYEYHAHACCEICANDPNCLFATTTLVGHCYTAPYVTAGAVNLTGTVSLRNKVETIWMDDSTKRGDFCQRCDCHEDSQTIDCRGKGLLILPKTFSESWSPKVLDLRENPRLAFIGSHSFEPTIATSLEELYIGADTVHIEQSNFESLVSLRTFHSDMPNFNNFITEESGAYADVCCSHGETVSLGTDKTLTFCAMQFDTPGVDAVYNDFEHYINPFNVEIITDQSDFMSEAAESPEKCAAYCQVNQDCLYFSYDRRIQNAFNICYLLADQGINIETVCCDADHYADFYQTVPGWVSGLPPKTRHDKLNARVLISNQELVANSKNNFQAEYSVSLGASPLRGAVWVEPSVSTTDSEGNPEHVDVTISPSKVVLYDSSSTTKVRVTFHDRYHDATILIRNAISSCDEAFTSRDAKDDIVIISVVALSDEEGNVVKGITFGLFVSLLVVTLLVWKIWKREDDSLWKVKREELTFSDPAQIVGRGTFGLVLLAEYRGTAVAVKRVIPPRRRVDLDPSGNQSTECEDLDIKSQSSEVVTIVNMTGETTTLDSRPRFWSYSTGSHSRSGSSLSPSLAKRHFIGKGAKRWKTMRQAFIDEMCYLSKLRHPCVTTIMGAVVEPNSEPMLVMEFMEHGSLHDLLRNETLLIEGELLLPILRDITQGMRFLHSANPQVIHGDLKAQNILVDGKFRAKVTDFGLARKSQFQATGTPYWMAPELLRGEDVNNSSTDVYSFGIILYEVFSRKEPYEGEEDPDEVLRLIKDRATQKRPPIPRHCPPQVQSLMTECLRDDASRRPSFEELDIRLRREDVGAVQPVSPSTLHKKSKHISLHDIFPKHVADALSQGRTVEPEHRDCVTIFFCDIVQFTEISSRLEPRKVANLLDRLYTKFDELSQKHDVFKVETIGDAYMAVTNLVKDQPDDHVKRIANFAVDAIKAANSTVIDLDDADQGVVHIRAGFHCGPVVADVVGTRNPRYCLFGDSVNIASRMESCSKSDRIHCTDIAAELLITQDPSIPLKSRGDIPIKGKGVLHTFWVNEISDRASKERKAVLHSRGSQRDVDSSLRLWASESPTISIRSKHSSMNDMNHSKNSSKNALDYHQSSTGVSDNDSPSGLPIQ